MTTRVLPYDIRASGYLPLLERAEHLQQSLSVAEDTIRALRHQLAVSEFRRLSMAIDQAIANQDRAAWEKACAARMRLGIGDAEMREIVALDGRAA
jgi:hypothetical protein